MKPHPFLSPLWHVCAVLLLFALGGCATAPAQNPQDPWEGMNRKIHTFNDKLDKALLKPVARAYVDYVPAPLRQLAGNFFSNLNDVKVTINDLLQLKFRQAASDGSRVLFNSTFGIFGLLNVTDRLPKHNEDFGQTLGYWGVPSGPYLVLPLLGPSSVRDGAGLYADSSYTDPVWKLPTTTELRATTWAANKVHDRAALLKQEDVLQEMDDPYAFIRDMYLRNRQNLVYDGNPPRERYIDEEDEE